MHDEPGILYIQFFNYLSIFAGDICTHTLAFFVFGLGSLIEHYIKTLILSILHAWDIGHTEIKLMLIMSFFSAG